jgi:ATP synthase protein I
MPRDPESHYRYVRLVGSMGTIPVMLGVGPLLGYFAGHWLDKKFGSDPWFLIIFVALGFAASVRYTVRLLRRVQHEIDRM